MAHCWTQSHPELTQCGRDARARKAVWAVHLLGWVPSQDPGPPGMSLGPLGFAEAPEAHPIPVGPPSAAHPTLASFSGGKHVTRGFSVLGWWPGPRPGRRSCCCLSKPKAQSQPRLLDPGCPSSPCPSGSHIPSPPHPGSLVPIVWARPLSALASPDPAPSCSVPAGPAQPTLGL